MAYLGLNNLPQYNPANSPLQQGVGMYQQMAQFPLLQQQRQANIAQTQLQNQYYPQVTQANIAQSQAQAALQKAQSNSPEINPVGAGNSLYAAYLNASSPQEKAYWAAQLNKQSVAPMNMMGMPASPAAGAFSANPASYGNMQTPSAGMGAPNSNVSGGTVPPMGFQAGQSYSAPMDQSGAMSNPILNFLSGYRAKGMQQATQDPNNPNNAVVTTSPTNTTTSNIQGRDLGNAELNVVNPIISKYVAPYNSPIEGNIRLLIDSGLARMGDQSAINRLSQYRAGQGLMSALGGSEAKQSGYTQPGIQFEQEIEKQNYPGLAEKFSDLIPAAANNAAAPLILSGANKINAVAQNLGAQNFPVSTPRSQLGWAGGVAGSNAPTQPQGSTAQNNVSQSQAFPPPPAFSNSDEARGWFKSLSPAQQTAYLNTLPRKK